MSLPTITFVYIFVDQLWDHLRSASLLDIIVMFQYRRILDQDNLESLDTLLSQNLKSSWKFLRREQDVKLWHYSIGFCSSIIVLNLFESNSCENSTKFPC